MSKVRIIIKETCQPPIDTTASIKHKTIEIESEELFELLANNEIGYEFKDSDKKHSTFSVIGAEPIFD